MVFSVIDVVDILTESASSRRYWSDLKRKFKNEGYDQLYENIVQLKMTALDGGAVAGRTRKDIEKKTEKSIVSKENYLLNDKKKELT